MSASIRIARRYAKAIVSLASDTNKLEEVKADMESFLSVSESNRDFELMLNSPIVPQEKKISILKAIFDGKVSEISLNLFRLLSEKKREAYLTAIATEFLNQYNELKGIVVATLYTAAAVGTSIKNSAKQLVEKGTGKQVILNEVIQEDLIGGYILRVEDIQLDTSVKSQLNKLRIKFKNA